MMIRILLADDHKIFRYFIRSKIELHPDLEVVGETGVGRQVMRMARDLSPDIVIMDVSMPHIDGIEAARELIAAVPEVKVIGLSMHTNARFVSAILEAGVSGYLLKETAFEDLIEAIWAVSGNDTYVCPAASVVIASERAPHTN